MKVIHGGLRYLQHGNIKRIRQSVRSRKIMQQVAPDLVKAVPFLVPTYGHGIRSKGAMSIAILINDLISFDRNSDIKEVNFIPNGYTIGRDELLKLLPGINENSLTGGAIWYEAVVQNTEKLLMRFLLDAYKYDFIAANYVEAADFIIQNNVVKGIIAKDLLNSVEFDISAKLIINAVGPWFNLIQNSLNISHKPKMTLTKAVNIIVRKKIFSPYGVGLEGTKDFSETKAIVKRGKRFFFFVPLEDYTMIGTTYKNYEGNIDDCKIRKEDIFEIIEEVNSICPGKNLTFDDVSFYHCGLLPMDETSGFDNIQPEKHSIVYDYEKHFNLKGLLSIKSVKYTTAPFIAESVVKKIKKKIKPSSDFIGQKNNSSQVEENRNPSNLICDDPPVTSDDIINAVRNEMACTLKDVVLRRTGMGMLSCPSYESIIATADIMAAELNWNEKRKSFEIDELQKVYSLLKNLEPDVRLS
jgi:glycerol-3-phosphate dehydrogenase